MGTVSRLKALISTRYGKTVPRYSGFIKTRVGVVVATLIFLSLIFLGELSPFQDLFKKNGITRDDVEKYRIHVLTLPELNKLTSKETSMNVTANLEQLGDSGIFRAFDKNKNYAYFKLGNNWDFSSVKAVADQPYFEQKNLIPYYSADIDDSKLILKRNDLTYKEYSLPQGVRHPKGGVILNQGKSLVIPFGSENIKKIAYLLDFENSALQFLNFKGEVIELISNRNDTRIYAKLAKQAENASSKCSLAYLDIFSDSLDPITLTSNCSRESRVTYSKQAGRVLILNDTELRILDADNGQVVEIINLKDLNTQDKSQSDSSFTLLDKVPAAILRGRLIDLRDGNIIDSLPGFSDESIFVIDYKNKNLYYSPTDRKGSRTMEIATYDLHNLALKLQIRLGSKNSEAEERNERKDVLADMFIYPGGFLVGISEPQ